jgi:hypothetical protein
MVTRKVYERKRCELIEILFRHSSAETEEGKGKSESG